MKPHLAALSLFGICGLVEGCVSPRATISTPPLMPTKLSGFYHSLAPGTTRKVERQYVHVDSAAERQALVASYLRKGYHLVGYDHFSDIPDASGVFKDQSPSDIIEQARRVGADVAIYGDYPVGRETVNYPKLVAFSTGPNAQNYYRITPTQVMRSAFFIEFLALP
jgi:hypothetical protein